MEKKCLWLEFEEAKVEVETLKEEKRLCKEAISVRSVHVMLVDVADGRADGTKRYGNVLAD